MCNPLPTTLKPQPLYPHQTSPARAVLSPCEPCACLPLLPLQCAEGCNYCLGAPDNCYGSCDDGYGLVAKPDSKAACERCTLDNCTECA